VSILDRIWQWFSPSTSLLVLGPGSTTTASSVDIGGLPGVRRAIQMISRDLARCPVEVWRGREKIEKHTALMLLNGPDAHPDLSSFHFRRWEVATMLAHGNALSVFAPGAGTLTPVPPSEWEAKITKGRLRYRVADEQNVDESFVLHQRGDCDYSQPWLGVSPLATCQQALRTAAARDAQLERLVQTGFVGKLAFVHPGPLQPDTRTKMRDAWMEQHGADSTHIPAFVGEDIKVQNLGQSAAQQMLDTRRACIADISLALDVPPALLWEGEGRSLVEVMMAYSDSLAGIAASLAAEYTRKLCNPGERVVVNTSGLVLSDIATAGRGIAQLVQVGVLAPNDARRRIGEMPSNDEGMDAAKPVISGVSPMSGGDNGQP